MLYLLNLLFKYAEQVALDCSSPLKKRNDRIKKRYESVLLVFGGWTPTAVRINTD